MDDEINLLLAQGARADELLNNTTYKTTVLDIKQAFTEIILGSSPSEAAKREHAYLMIRALGDIEALLKARVIAKDQYLLNLEQSELF